MPSGPNGLLIILALCGIGLTGLGLYRSYSAGWQPDLDTKHPIVGKTFRNQEVQVDGKIFNRCTFENVTFFYRAKQPFQMAGCTFLGTRLIRTDNAEVVGMVGLMKGLGYLVKGMPIHSDVPLNVEEPGASPTGQSQ